MPEYKDLSEEEFNKVALKFNSTRDVYGFVTILSLTKRQVTLQLLLSFEYRKKASASSKLFNM